MSAVDFALNAASNAVGGMVAIVGLLMLVASQRVRSIAELFRSTADVIDGVVSRTGTGVPIGDDHAEVLKYQSEIRDEVNYISEGFLRLNSKNRLEASRLMGEITKIARYLRTSRLDSNASLALGLEAKKYARYRTANDDYMRLVKTRDQLRIFAESLGIWSLVVF